GASAGIGSYTAEALYRQGATVYMACRNEEKTQKVISQIKKKKVNYEGGSLNFIKLDFNNLESVRECAREFLHGGLVLDVLINNAGCAVGGERYSVQGYEEMFQSNVLGHHLLVDLLWNNMNGNPNGARIVIVSSYAHMFIKDYEFYNTEKKVHTLMNRNKQYGFTKLCNIYQTYYFNERIKNTPNCKVTVNACHPGAIKSELSREVPYGLQSLISLIQYFFFVDLEIGSQNTLHLACSKDVSGISGKFFDQCAVKEPLPITKNKELYNELVDLCEKVCSSYSL
ncbi:predicted protein, partial [Naegleria gruberi]